MEILIRTMEMLILANENGILILRYANPIRK